MAQYRHHAGTVAIAVLLTLTAGCTLQTTDGDGELSDQRVSALAGFNGSSLNGSSLNGSSLNGSSLNGSSLNGSSLNGVSLTGSSLTGKTTSGQLLTGQTLVGSVLNGLQADGSPASWRIDGRDVVQGDVNRYTVSFKTPGTDWTPVCGEIGGVPVRAVPLAGTWNYQQGVPGGGSKINDPNMITLACEGFALAKCVEFGYKPWGTISGKATLADYHQACTRMLRADYCGDGTSWTVNGTLINLYDNKGIQTDDAAWPFEAEWDTEGAMCLSHQRIQNMPAVPHCDFDKTATKCGNPISWKKALLATEAQ